MMTPEPRATRSARDQPCWAPIRSGFFIHTAPKAIATAKENSPANAPYAPESTGPITTAEAGLRPSTNPPMMSKPITPIDIGVAALAGSQPFEKPIHARAAQPNAIAS
jgi:hypothetical protein